jgi:glycosyltransferase 2 family protein
MELSTSLIWAGLRTALGLGLFYYVLSATNGWTAVKQLISTVWLLPGLAALTLFGAAIEAKRLGYLFESQGMRLSFFQGYRVVAIGTLFNYCIPGGTGGDVMKLYYLASNNRGRGIEVAALLLVDRTVALFSLLFLIVVLALLDGRLVRAHSLISWLVAAAVIGMLGLLAGGVVACSARIRASGWYNYLLARLPLQRYLARIANALYSFRKQKMTLLKAASLSLVAHLALAAMFMAAGMVFFPKAPGLSVSLLALLGLLANALPITPGGLGVGEAAFEGLFRSVGYPGGAQLIVVWRAGMMALCCVGCALYIVGSRSRRPSLRSGDRLHFALRKRLF